MTETLETAQQGQFFVQMARQTGLGEAQARAAMAVLMPKYATLLHQRAEDPEAFADLLELLDEGEQDALLDSPEGLADPEALEDGEAVLADLYGSPSKAFAATHALLPDLNPHECEQIAPLAAVTVLALLARANPPHHLFGTSAAEAENMPGATAPADSGGGFLGTILASLTAGAIEGATRALAPRKRRRATGYFGPRRTARRTSRSARTPIIGLDDIFRSILGNRRR